MSKKENDKIKSIFSVIIGALAILALKSIFENDNSEIVSKKGRKILSDKSKMDKLNKEISESKTNNSHNGIFIYKPEMYEHHK